MITMLRANRWVLAAALGAALNGLSATLVKVSAAEPAAVTVYRCVYAVPFLLPMLLFERRWRARARTGYGARGGESSAQAKRSLRWDIGSWALLGLLFAVDLVLWNASILDIGAGIATVIVNMQVVFVALASGLFGQRPSRRLMLLTPVVLLGLVLAAGVVGEGAAGTRPVTGAILGIGAAVAYSAYLIVLRQVTGSSETVLPPLLGLTVFTAGWAALLGVAIGQVNFMPTWPSHGWLLLVALSGQVFGWLLVVLCMPRLPVALTSLLLVLQPVTALGLGAVILGEHPSIYQLLGVGTILTAVVLISRRPTVDTTDHHAASRRDTESSRRS